MAYENSGRLFKNDKKSSDKAPDYRGDFTDADGKKMEVSAWVKPGTEGRPNWLSFKISERYKSNNPEGATPVDLGDEVPF